MPHGELNLTESAVSRQIATLAAQPGVRPFVRARQRVALTRSSRLHGAQVRRALDNLDRNTPSIIVHGGGGSHLEPVILPTGSRRARA